MSKNIHIFIGNMGSGKSEISINYTLKLMKSQQKAVKLLDLDIIKPYIRIRDVQNKLIELGIDLLLPEKKIKSADMPIIPSRMIDYLLDDSFDLVIDVGGESRGVLTIAQFDEYFKKNNTFVYFVINTLRPFMETEDQIIETINDLELSLGLKINYLISNSHLRFESSIDQSIKGLKILRNVSNKKNIPIYFVCIWDNLINNEDSLNKICDTQVLPIKLYLSFPWETSN
jgi:hypothetical protein